MNKEIDIEVKDWNGGGYSVTVDGRLFSIKYNTGDEVWFDLNSTELKVIALATSDGITWGTVPPSSIRR